jgi:hypothetical protein
MFMPPLFFSLFGWFLKQRSPEDWAMLALLAATATAMLISERFWSMLPF